MRTAEITNHDGTGYMVQLMDNGNLFGTIDVRSKSIHYAKDVVENWENGILKKDNQHIRTSSSLTNNSE